MAADKVGCIPNRVSALSQTGIGTREVVVKLLRIGEVLRMSAETRKSFEKLVQAGMDRQDLAARLCMIPLLPSVPTPLIPGTSQETIKDFPK